MRINPGRMNKRIQIWKNRRVDSEDTYCEEVIPEKIKEIWAEITPKTGSLLSGREAGTVLSKTTHQIRCRYDAAKEITPDCWIIYRDQTGKEHRFDIDYLFDPFLSCKVIDIYVQEVV